MGMDVIGHNPTGPKGEFFRASLWHWPLLVKIVTTLCPQETSSCKSWEYNEGDGLDCEQALALAEALERKLRSGEVAFALCDPGLISISKTANVVGDFFRSQGAVIEHPEPLIDEHFVAEFAAFVRASGGFSIW
jgi:hypothetical protein